jgi:hypothetical protein
LIADGGFKLSSVVVNRERVKLFKKLLVNFELGLMTKFNPVNFYFIFLLVFQVDLTRVNEFGYSGDMLDDPTKAVEAVEGPETKALENSNGDVPKPKADKKKD